MSSHDDKPHVPVPSLWPIGFAIGIVCLLVGFVVSWWGVAIGAALTIVFGFLWVYDLTRGMREPADAPVPGTATVEVADAPAPAHEELPTYNRSVFLELSTLGLGAAIGGLVTLPVLGFAVIPAFQGNSNADVDLGPVSNFPEGDFVVSTFLEDPAQGEVSRRTAFIRNNGPTKDPATGKDVLSFTIIYSRCAHLGCPVQPGGLLKEDQKKTVPAKGTSEDITLIPVSGLTGFGCPCHGGQYDIEGNRVAGPPVRSLDRFTFSIVHGRLVLGTLYSVGTVEGSGATAQIQRYTSAAPGVHVDGWERWLYPIPVPGR